MYTVRSVTICLLVLVGLVVVDGHDYPRGCVFQGTKCAQECEPGTQLYTSQCGYVTPEAICEQPHPVEDKRGKVCEYSACYCEPGLVRHVPTKTCVKLCDCQKQNSALASSKSKVSVLVKVVATASSSSKSQAPIPYPSSPCTRNQKKNCFF